MNRDSIQPTTNGPRPEQRPTRRTTGRRQREERRTDRGQTELLGAILLFGLLISLVVLIQVAAVPTWNQQLEFEHSQRAGEDLQLLGQVISDVAADGGDRSAVVEVGLRYPQRPFLFNPAPPQGQLTTTDVETVTIEDSRLVGVDNYWTDAESFDTRAIRYDTSYNEYRNNPTTTYEYGLLVDRFPNGFERPTRTLPVVNGTNVNLVLVDGGLSESASGAVSVPVEGTSAPSTGVKLTGTDADPSDGIDPIVITLPTENPTVWVDQLADEPNVQNVAPTATGVEIELDGTKTYNLRMAEITVGSGDAVEGAAYITTQGDPTRVVARNTSNELVVEVRDRFNNPIPGVEVTFAITGGAGADGATLADTTATSGEDGTASVFLETLDDGAVDVEATINSGGTAAERTTFTVDAVEGGIRATGGDGEGGAEDGVSELNPESNVPVFTGLADPVGGADHEFDACFYNPNADRTFGFSEARVSFYFTTQGGSQAPTSVEFVDSTAGAKSLPSPFVDVSSLDEVSTQSNGQSRLGIDFTSGDSTKGDIFVISVRYDVGGDDVDTFSYLVAPPNNPPATCPAPP